MRGVYEFMTIDEIEERLTDIKNLTLYISSEVDPHFSDELLNNLSMLKISVEKCSITDAIKATKLSQIQLEAMSELSSSDVLTCKTNEALKNIYIDGTKIISILEEKSKNCVCIKKK